MFVSSTKALTILEMCVKCWDQHVAGDSEEEGWNKILKIWFFKFKRWLFFFFKLKLSVQMEQNNEINHIKRALKLVQDSVITKHLEFPNFQQ